MRCRITARTTHKIHMSNVQPRAAYCIVFRIIKTNDLLQSAHAKLLAHTQI